MPNKLRIAAKNLAKPRGFTLVELLTVIAIVAVLATLLTSALSTAKRKARQTVSVGNLRQIALAFNLYMDDHTKRPFTFASMVQEKLLTQKSLLCAEDRIYANWAGLIEDVNSSGGVRAPVVGVDGGEPAVSEVPHSYFKAFDVTDEVWERIEKNPSAGIAACQLHGIGRESREVAPSITAFQGLVLRALKDTSVVSRQVFWQNESADKGAPGTSGPVSSFVPSSAPSDLPLFLDTNE